MQDNYFDSIRENAVECLFELNKLASILEKKKALTRIEYAASERFLQVLIESAIGCAKQKCKKINNFTPNDAYESFQKLFDAELISARDLEQWKKIVGLRNVIVHDYLNIDHAVIDRLLLQKS